MASNARTHSHQSNRATISKGKTEDKKAVFRSVLDNPYEVKWPAVPHNIQNLVLARSLQLLAGMAEYTVGRRLHSRKRKRTTRLTPSSAAESGKRQRLTSDHHLGDEAHGTLAPALPSVSIVTDDSQSTSAISTYQLSPPAVYTHIRVGINEVTKHLELQARQGRRPPVLLPEKPSSPPSYVPLRLVLVCLHDLESPAMAAHVPRLVAACNSIRLSADDRGTQPVKLVALPTGTEATLAASIGLRRASVLAFDVETPSMDDLADILQSIPTLAVPWMTPPMLSQQRYEPTHIKQLKTTAPKDIKAAKQKRLRGKAKAKLHRQTHGIISKKMRKRRKSELPTTNHRAHGIRKNVLE